MRVAAIQLCAGPDPAANLAHATERIRAAASGGAQLVVLPEKWLAIGGADALRPAAQHLDGPVVNQLAQLAADLRIDLIAGSIPEAPAPDDPDQRLANTALHLGPDGTLRAAYRKLHLFDADIAGTRYRESDAERPGRGPVTTTLADGTTTGLTICFDLRFAPLYATLAAAGATLITIPAAFTLTTTRAHWEPLLRARAIEHGIHIVAANQHGTHPDGTTSGGHSLIISPWGDLLATAPETGDATITADLSPDDVTRAHEALPVHALTRPDAYAATPTNGLASTDPNPHLAARYPPGSEPPKGRAL
jgi:predicted amidohydrolase